MVHRSQLEIPKNQCFFCKQIFHFNFRIPFEVNNFVIQTWNVVLLSKYRFVSKNGVSVSEISVLVVEEHSVLGIYSFTFRMLLNSGLLRSGSTKCRFCFRKQFVFRDLGGGCAPHKPSTSSRILYCKHSTQCSHLVISTVNATL